MCQTWCPLPARYLVFCCDWHKNKLERCKDFRQEAVKEQLVNGVTSADPAYVEIGFFWRGWVVDNHINHLRCEYLCPYTSLVNCWFSCAELLTLIAVEVKIAPDNYLCVGKLLCHLLISVNNLLSFLHPSSRVMAITSQFLACMFLCYPQYSQQCVFLCLFLSLVAESYLVCLLWYPLYFVFCLPLAKW